MIKYKLGILKGKSAHETRAMKQIIAIAVFALILSCLIRPLSCKCSKNYLMRNQSKEETS